MLTTSVKWEYHFVTKPDSYQYECLKRALRRKKYGIFFEQRVGKSKVGIDFAGVLAIKEGIKKVLIISPLSARSVWLDEQIPAHMNIPYQAFAYPPKGKTKALIDSIRNPAQLTFVVMTYNQLEEVERLKRWNPDVLILDEVHYLKRYTSNRSRRVGRLSRQTKYVLGLTGTPQSKGAKDIYGVFTAIDAAIFGKWSSFKALFCKMGGYMGKEVVGVKNERILVDLMGSASMRILRKDVMDEPEVEKVNILVELEPRAQQMYDEIRIESLALLDSGDYVVADLPTLRISMLHRLCGGFVTDEHKSVLQVSKAKLVELVELVKDLDGEKLIIVAEYTAEIRAIADALSKLNPLVYEGRTSEKDRMIARQLFQTSPKHNIIILQARAGGIGIPLHAASRIAFYSLSWSLTAFQQVRDRIMGRDQKSPAVTWYFLTVKNSVDQRVMDVLANNEDFSKRVIDSYRWVLEGGG